MVISCKQAKKLMKENVAGELPIEKKEILQQHIDTCNSCLKYSKDTLYLKEIFTIGRVYQEFCNILNGV